MDEINEISELKSEHVRFQKDSQVTISKDQAWFWSEQWQEEALEVEQQIKDGLLSDSKNLGDTLSDLDKLSDN